MNLNRIGVIGAGIMGSGIAQVCASAGLQVTLLALMQVLHEGFADPKYRPARLLRELAAAGHLGRKSGRGFFSY